MTRPRSGSLIWQRAARMSSGAIVGSVLSLMLTSLTSAHGDGRARDPRGSGIRSQREAARGDWPWRLEWARLGLDVLSVAVHPHAIWRSAAPIWRRLPGRSRVGQTSTQDLSLMSMRSALMCVIHELLPHWGLASGSPRFRAS